MAVFRSLAHRPFALLWSGQTVSRLGDSLYSIALAWWVLEKTGSAAAMGVVLICSTIPMLLLLLVGGVAVDRLPRVRLMLTSDLVRGALVALIAFLAFQDWLELWQLFVLSALFGVVRAFFYPAYTAIIPDLVPAEMLPSANSLRSTNLQMAQIIGPGIGAAIVAFGGTTLAFALDGRPSLSRRAAWWRCRRRQQRAKLLRLPPARLRMRARASARYWNRPGCGLPLRLPASAPFLWMALLRASCPCSSNSTSEGKLASMACLPRSLPSGLSARRSGLGASNGCAGAAC